jgi:adenylate cyclase
MERRLAAIFSTDVQGYSRLMGEDEVATIRTITVYREVMATLIQQHRGRVVDSPGDNLLAEFASVVEAVQCAVAIQRELSVRNAELPPHRRMEFRIGINLGDVIAEGERIYGDGVNIAARLEGLAEAGGLCISGTVYDQVKTRLALGYEDLGAQAVKNSAEPVRVYRVLLEPEAAAPAASQKEGMIVVGAGHTRRQKGDAAHRVLRVLRQKGVLALVGLVLILGGLVAGWQRYLAARPPTLALPSKPSIAVLPFANLSGDPAQDYFSDGMTEVLITDLSKVADLFVIARNSVFTYKGKAVEVSKVGKELGVRYVLEGSVLRAGDKVRITAQLVDATTAYHLWSERYDRDLQNIFALQDELAQKILLALRVKLTPAEQVRFRRAPTKNLEAYDYFLRGRESHRRSTKEANVQAQQMFERAISLDPQYAAAYAALGLSRFMAWRNGWLPQSSLEQVLTLAQKAVELDDSLPLAHRVLGSVYLWQKQHDRAIAAAERALALDPNDADSHFALAWTLAFAGRPEEAIGLMAQAMRLDPAYPVQYLVTLGDAYHLTGRYEEAMAVAQRALARHPNLFRAHELLALSASALGREKEARTAVAELLKLAPNFPLLETQKLTLPYKDPAIMERRSDLLHRAGVQWRWYTANHEALGHVWSGLESLSRYTQAETTQARQRFERAIALDPQYAGAHAFLGWTYLQEWIWQWSADPQTLDRAVALIQQALALDASLPSVHGRLSLVYVWKKQHDQAITQAEQAVSLDPNDAEGYLRLAEVLNFAGQPEKALEWAEKALRLRALFPGGEYLAVVGWTYQLLGQYEKAIAPLKQAIGYAPQYPGSHALLAVSYSEAGREEEARAEAAALLRLNPHYSVEVDRQRRPYKDPAVLDRHLAALRKAELR